MRSRTMTEKTLAEYRFGVDAKHGDRSVHTEVNAAYVKNENGFLAFKNARHETVLLVNCAHVITVERGVGDGWLVEEVAAKRAAVAEAKRTGGIVPAGYTMDATGEVRRLVVDESQMRDSYDQSRHDLLPDKGR
jgi:hypothetical protein